MVDGDFRGAWALLITVALLAGMVVGATPARATEHCYYDPGTSSLVCDDGGGGEPDPTLPTTGRHGGSSVSCGGGGGAWRSHRRYHDRSHPRFTRSMLSMGRSSSHKSTCIDLDDVASAIWEAGRICRYGFARSGTGRPTLMAGPQQGADRPGHLAVVLQPLAGRTQSTPHGPIHSRDSCSVFGGGVGRSPSPGTLVTDRMTCLLPHGRTLRAWVEPQTLQPLSISTT